MLTKLPPLSSVGTDPDYRFTLANERTFLAWLRTSLALLAGAIALAGLIHDFGPRYIRIGISVLLLILSLTVIMGAYRRWYRAERALRENRPLPTDPLLRIIVSGLGIIIVAAAALIFLAEIGR